MLVPSTDVEPNKLLRTPTERNLVRLDNDMKQILAQKNIAKDIKLSLYYRALQNYMNTHSKLTKPSYEQQFYPQLPSDMESTIASSFEYMRPEQQFSKTPSFQSIPQNDNYPYRTSTPIPLVSPSLVPPVPIHQSINFPPSPPDRSSSLLEHQTLQSNPSKSSVRRSRNDDDAKIVDDVIKTVTKHPEILNFDEKSQEIIYKGQRIPNTNITDILTHRLHNTNNIPEGTQLVNSAIEEIANIPHIDSLKLIRARKRPLNRKRKLIELRGDGLRKKKSKITPTDFVLYERKKRKFPGFPKFPNKKQKIGSVNRQKWIKM